MFDRLLSAIGLKTPFAQRYANTIASLDSTLVEAARSMQLGFGDDEHSPYLGYYCPVQDKLAVSVFNLTQGGQCVNNVWAHELIHSTGHYKRLNRWHVGEISKYGGSEYVPESELDSEEVIAQYGAKLLLSKLGIDSKGIEEDTARYLRKYGRPEGPTEWERVQAVRAVKYILSSLNRTNQMEEFSHAETG